MRKKFFLNYKKIVLPLFMAAVLFCGQAFSYLLAADAKMTSFSIAETGVNIWHAYDADNDGYITMPDNTNVANASFDISDFNSADNTTSDEIYKTLPSSGYSLSPAYYDGDSVAHSGDTVYNIPFVENSSGLNKIVYAVVKNPTLNSYYLYDEFGVDYVDIVATSLDVEVDFYAYNAPSTIPQGGLNLETFWTQQNDSRHLNGGTVNTHGGVTPVYSINDVDNNWVQIDKKLVDVNSFTFEYIIYAYNAVLQPDDVTSPVFTNYTYLPAHSGNNGQVQWIPGEDIGLFAMSFIYFDSYADQYNTNFPFPENQFMADITSYIYIPEFFEVESLLNHDLSDPNDQPDYWMDDNFPDIYFEPGQLVQFGEILDGVNQDPYLYFQHFKSDEISYVDVTAAELADYQ